MKKKSQFHIIRNDSTTHGGYYTGTLNLNNLSAILVHHDQAKIDLGLIHAKSRVERGIRFTSNREEIQQGEWYWVVWVAIDQNEQGPYYAGVTACPMMIDHEARRGWKNLADHVNRMDDALKRRIKVDEMGDIEKKALKERLIAHNEDMWRNSTSELRQALSSTKKS